MYAQQLGLVPREKLLALKRQQYANGSVPNGDFAEYEPKALAPSCVEYWNYTTPRHAQGWQPQTGIELKAVMDDAHARIEAAYQDGMATLSPNAFATLKQFAAACGPSLITRGAARKLAILEGRVRMATMEISQERRAAEAAAAAQMPLVITTGDAAAPGGGGLIPILAAGAAAMLLL